MYLARKIIVAISIGATGIVVVATGRTFGDAGRTFLGDVCEMGYATRHKMAKLYSWRGFADINIRNTAPNGVLRDTMRVSVRRGGVCEIIRKSIRNSPPKRKNRPIFCRKFPAQQSDLSYIRSVASLLTSNGNWSALDRRLNHNDGYHGWVGCIRWQPKLNSET